MIRYCKVKKMEVFIIVDMKILRAEFRNLAFFMQKEVTIDFITEKKVSPYEADDNAVTHLFNHIYKLNTLAFIGINASGKTSALTVLLAALNMHLGNDSLSYEMDIVRFFHDYLEVVAYYYEKQTSTIYKIHSRVKKDEQQRSLYFEDETLFRKKVTALTNKNNLFDFNEADETLNRSTLNNVFLKTEDSIFSSLMNKYKTRSPRVIDMRQVTYNALGKFDQNMVLHFITYLDPSIEQFEMFFSEDKTMKFKLKFADATGTIITDRRHLDEYLSSGTIKGINVLSNVFRTFQVGGYLLIDEIENHLNKVIVQNIIHLFNSTLNKNSATLLFSTHYAEILDAIDRSDSIYVLRKKQYIDFEKFSDAAGIYDRKDRKKSDLMLSGVIDTSPKYEAYMELIAAFKKHLNGAIS